ncbi:MAG: hypothetical protein K9J84_04695 [Bacteroidia bacterium]|nr:hypothetical protein [Bacteroidia bacterium]
MLLIAVTAIIAACNEEPKMTQQEETAVETQINSDQKAMDSLEAAIKAQMDELGADSLEMDSL